MSLQDIKGLVGRNSKPQTMLSFDSAIGSVAKHLGCKMRISGPKPTGTGITRDWYQTCCSLFGHRKTSSKKSLSLHLSYHQIIQQVIFRKKPKIRKTPNVFFEPNIFILTGSALEPPIFVPPGAPSGRAHDFGLSDIGSMARDLEFGTAEAKTVIPKKHLEHYFSWLFIFILSAILNTNMLQQKVLPKIAPARTGAIWQLHPLDQLEPVGFFGSANGEEIIGNQSLSLSIESMSLCVP